MRVGMHGDTDPVYLAELKDSERFEELLRQSKGFADLQQRDNVLWIADGLPYNWNVQKRLCPKAKGLLDFYHAMENASQCGKAVLGDDAEMVDMFRSRIAHLLLNGEIDMFFDELKECIPYKPRKKRDKENAEALWDFYNYMDKHRERLSYAEFLENGWPIGSGAIESAHKHVIQTRMKQAGMRWSVDGAQHMLTLRALYSTVGPKRFPEFIKAA